MALPVSGPLSLDDIQIEFGGTNPIGINEYYGAAAGIPASGTISINDFYGASNAQIFSINRIDTQAGTKLYTSSTNLAASTSPTGAVPVDQDRWFIFQVAGLFTFGGSPVHTAITVNGQVASIISSKTYITSSGVAVYAEVHAIKMNSLPNDNAFLYALDTSNNSYSYAVNGFQMMVTKDAPLVVDSASSQAITGYSGTVSVPASGGLVVACISEQNGYSNPASFAGFSNVISGLYRVDTNTDENVYMAFNSSPAGPSLTSAGTAAVSTSAFLLTSIGI